MRTLPLATLALAALLLSGCVPESPPATPSPAPSSTPVFASEEDALAAAEAAYAAYLKVSDQIAQDGGANPERIEPFVTPDRLATELEALGKYQSRNVKTQGSTTFDTATVAQYSQDSSGADVDIYVCLDVSNVRIIDSSGGDATPERQDRLPLEIGFQSPSSKPDGLLLSSSDLWTGDDFCTA